ncbi:MULTISPECIES: hypothetical protein [Franconibacter]|jgi:hypothetical protein|uniref:Uncharacterized protein n=1 Tax=Franconibacter daqui TaxID=2047724 RepID=A0ABV1PQG3_9ENTR|nr:MULTISPECIES: hypothetical protein [Franconibacter]MEB5924064.1 hypothetical protein [Franconibacter daqui]
MGGGTGEPLIGVSAKAGHARKTNKEAANKGRSFNSISSMTYFSPPVLREFLFRCAGKLQGNISQNLYAAISIDLR